MNATVATAIMSNPAIVPTTPALAMSTMANAAGAATAKSNTDEHSAEKEDSSSISSQQRAKPLPPPPERNAAFEMFKNVSESSVVLRENKGVPPSSALYIGAASYRSRVIVTIVGGNIK